MRDKDREQIIAWRSRLWRMAKRAAKKHDGVTVIKALQQATKRLNKIGMDKVYDDLTKADSTSGLYYAFDITWLAALATELERLPQSK